MARDRIVSVQTTDERGGAEYANVDLLRALAGRGHDVVLVTNLPELAAGTGIRVRQVDLGHKLRRETAVEVMLQAPRTLLRLARALYAERPIGTVLLHFKKEQLLASLLPPRLTGSIVWFEWGPVPPQLRGGAGRWLYAQAARRVRRVLAVSEGTRRTVVGTGIPPEKVDVVPNLVATESVAFDPSARRAKRGEWGAGDSTLVIGCVSRLQRRKRTDVVVDAMSHVDGDVLLVIAGEGEEEQALRRRAESDPDRIRFVPTVRGQVEAFLSACDLLVFAPSPTEGAPRAIVMAQLVGLPVVATDGEGAEDLITDGTGTIVTPSHDPRALATVIEAYRAEPDRRRREGDAGRRAALQRHDRERTLAAIERALG